MLVALFRIGAERYALEGRKLVEILPAVSLRSQPGAPRGCVGLLSYRERVVPVIDLGLMMLDQAAPAELSTRIIVARYAPGPEGACIGLRVEGATDARDIDPEGLRDPGIKSDAAPYLGAVMEIDGELVQLVEIERLLSPAVRDALFRTDAVHG